MWNTLAIIAGATGLSFLNQSAQRKADSKAYRRQVNLMKMQQAYATEMANTAHQREVKDLRAAGLNPILSATGGNGAASPVISAPSVSTGSRQDFFDSGTFMDSLKTGAEIGLTENTAAKAKADTDLAEQQLKKVKADTKSIALDNELKESKVNLLKPLTEFSKDQSKAGYWDDVKRGVKSIFKDSFHSAQGIVADVLKPLFLDKPSSGKQLHKKYQDQLWNEVQKLRENNPGFEFSKKGDIIYSHPKKKIEYKNIRMRSNEELDREFKKLKRRKK